MSTRAHMRELQSGLHGLRYDPGPVDGVWGSKTEGAVRALLLAGGAAAAQKVTSGRKSELVILQDLAKYVVREIVIHCSATRPGWFAGRSAKAKMAEIRRWHVKDRGWKDVGYHYLIDRDGTIVAGRAENVVGAHVIDRNRGTIGVCLVGGGGSRETDKFDEHFTREQKRSLLGLVASISTRTPVKRVSGHNEYAAKACPGFNVPTFSAFQHEEDVQKRSCSSATGLLRSRGRTRNASPCLWRFSHFPVQEDAARLVPQNRRTGHRARQPKRPTPRRLEQPCVLRPAPHTNPSLTLLRSSPGGQ